LKVELGPRRNFVGAVAAPPSAARTNGGTAAEAALADTDEADSTGRAASLAALEERVALLESTTGMIFGTLKKVLRMLRSRASNSERTVA